MHRVIIGVQDDIPGGKCQRHVGGRDYPSLG